MRTFNRQSHYTLFEVYCNTILKVGGLHESIGWTVWENYCTRYPTALLELVKVEVNEVDGITCETRDLVAVSGPHDAHIQPGALDVLA